MKVSNEIKNSVARLSDIVGDLKCRQIECQEERSDFRNVRD